MGGFLKRLHRHSEIVEGIGEKIEAGEAYMDNVRSYLPMLNQTITEILQMAQEPDGFLDLNQGFVVQVLNDILYGIEHGDSVYLLDVLRYGLLEIYNYVGSELQSGGVE